MLRQRTKKAAARRPCGVHRPTSAGRKVSPIGLLLAPGYCQFSAIKAAQPRHAEPLTFQFYCEENAFIHCLYHSTVFTCCKCIMKTNSRICLI